MLTSKNLVETLREHAFLAGFRPEHIERLAAMANEVHFDRDQIIFREGDKSTFLYLIVSGKVALEVTALAKTLRIQTLRDGDELGWSSVMPGGARRFQARALTKVCALLFDGEQLREAGEQDCSFGYALMRRLYTVLSNRFQAFRMQMLDM